MSRIPCRPIFDSELQVFVCAVPGCQTIFSVKFWKSREEHKDKSTKIHKGVTFGGVCLAPEKEIENKEAPP